MPSATVLRFRFALRPLALAIPAALLSLAPGWVAAATPTASEQPSTARHYAIAPGSLAAVLNTFSEQAGIFLAGHNDLAAGKHSPGLRGQYSVPQALELLLQGTGLQARPQANGGYILRAAPQAGDPLELDATSVSALGLGSVTEGSGSYTTGATASATRLALSLRETPQSVTVITRQQLDDQGSTSIADALRRAPGVSVENYDSERWEFSARGMPITNFQYDGVNTTYDGVYDYGTTSTDMATFDRIEIIKGASGLMTGSGDPSATVNLIRKRPTKTFKASVTGAAGSWDNYRTEGDISGPLTDSGTVRGRFVGVYQDRESYLDHYQNNKDIAYGILEVDITPQTLLTFGLDQQNTRSRGATWTGFAMFDSQGTRTDFSRSFNPGTDWSRRDFKNQTLFASLEQQLANDWSLKISYDRKQRDHDTLLGSASGGNPNPDGSGMFMYMGKYKGRQIQNNVDISATGPFSLLGREHELVVGFMSTSAKQDVPVYGSVYPLLDGSIYDWHGEFAKPDIPKSADNTVIQRQNGVYLATRLKPTDDLSVILGTRISNFKADDKTVYFDPTKPLARGSYHQTSVITPYAGLVYDLNDTYSAYASYTRIYQPQMSKDAARNLLDPVEGDSYEAGIKAEYLDGRVNASFAVFRIEQDNVASKISGDSFDAIYAPIKGATTKGFELEVAGELSPGWNLGAGYTYSHTRDAEGNPVYGSVLMSTEPAQLIRLFSTYKLQGALQGLTVGGGVNWQSEFFGQVFRPDPGNLVDGGEYTKVTQESYALVDLMTRYQFNEHLSTTLNLKNALDKKYYTGIGNFSTGFYGEPRSLLLTTQWNF